MVSLVSKAYTYNSDYKNIDASFLGGVLAMWKEIKSGFALIVAHQRKKEFNKNIYLFIYFLFIIL